MTILAWEPAVMTHPTDGMPELPGEEIARACRLHEQALACRAAGRIGEAGPLAEGALEIFERESGTDHPDVANLLLCLAGIRESAGPPKRGPSTGTPSPSSRGLSDRSTPIPRSAGSAARRSESRLPGAC
jgi:hypothetical protein